MPQSLSWMSQSISGSIFVALVLFLSGGFTCWGRPVAQEIFEGVIYGCKKLDHSRENRGVVHWVRIDLTVPGIELYVTPKNAAAVSQGWQYRLRRVVDVVTKDHLSVAINATLFSSRSGMLPRMSGDFANSLEPVVADHVVSHIWPDAYFLWFDDQLTPHLRPAKPLRMSELFRAKWGIGGQDCWLREGKVWSRHSRTRRVNAQTAVAVDSSRRLLFFAVGTFVSPRLVFQTLADLGAKNGMLLDGGESSSMTIGKDASGVAPGAVYGSWRPVATQFGVRAKPLLRRDGSLR